MNYLLASIPAFFILYRLFETDWNTYYLIVALLYTLPLTLIFKRKPGGVSWWPGVMISYCLLDHIFSQVSISNLKEAARYLNYWYLIPSVILVLTGHVAQTFRWGCLLERVKRLGFFDLFPSLMIGYLVNNLLPAKAGEFVKAFHLGNSKGLSKISILATVTVEKVFDGLTILIFLLVSLFALDEKSEKIKYISLAAGSVYIGGLLFMLLICFYREGLKKIYKKYLSRKTFLFISGVTEPFIKGLQVFKNPMQIFQVFLLSFIMWTLTALSLLPILRMFDFNTPFYTPFFILSFICFGQTLPVAPAGIGIINFASVLSLEIIFKNTGIPVSDLLYTEIAIFSLIVNAVMVIPETVTGLYYALTTDMGFKAMIKKSGVDS